MSDPYADQFAREYISSADFGRMYGIGNEVNLRISQFGTIERRDPDPKANGTLKPRAVLWFVEHPRLPFFVNRTMHEIFLDRFGNLYWTHENRDLILYAPLRLRAYQDRIFGKLQTIVEIDPSQYPNHREAIGKNGQQKFIEYCKRSKIDFAPDKFRWFVHQTHPDTLHIFDSSDGISQLPALFRPILNEYVSELKADMTHATKPKANLSRKVNESRTEPPSESKAGDGPPDFHPPKSGEKVEFAHDDIPF